MPITLTFPDASQRTFDAPLTGVDLALSISKSLAKRAVLLSLDDVLYDLSHTITQDARVRLLSADDPAALETLRHDAAHIMAQAVKALYPHVQVTIGPSIENGFYSDFHAPEPFREEDLAAIEAKMRQIVEAKIPLVREVWERNTAITFFEGLGEHFKAEIIRDLAENEVISLYRQGDFVDLCRGPHFPTTGHRGTAFQLQRVAGAYWRGDAKNPMLQRIYGTAWASQEDLKAYLTMLEEAEKRDHRKLGRAMELFHFQDEAPGSIFWHPAGWTLYQGVVQYILKKMQQHGYQEVNTPILVDKTLWEQSGHWDKFRDNMFVCQHGDDEKTFAIKPMNCPGHVQIFKQGIKSYRDLPLRLTEFNTLHRNESSGSLHGLLRLRTFHQDDAHIFCTPDQINEEAVAFCALLKEIYADFGFHDVHIKFSDRPEKRAGSDDTWDRAEKALKEAAVASGLAFTLNPGEGAFYGPKLEFVLRDAIGRDWQCGTLQCDFILPERLGAHYVDASGDKVHPVMLHRAILGSLERFIGILLENTAGHLPLWLAPTQVAVLTITSAQDAAASAFYETLKRAGMRAVLDTRSEKVSYKIREHSLKKVPILAIIGAKEAEDGTVTLRRLGSVDIETLSQKDFLENQALGSLAKGS
ncbi:MAG: threonine--tRNA ligase [Alphaproteobacteria bacterium]